MGKLIYGTSTEIALNLVGSPDIQELSQGIELVTNNHLDTDGVLSVWTMLVGERAQDLRQQLIAAAENGDFSEYTNENAVRASIVIQGSDSPTDKSGSPLAQQIADALLLAKRPLVISGSSSASDNILHAASNIAKALCERGKPAGITLVLLPSGAILRTRRLP